jgi:hypothetical protein
MATEHSYPPIEIAKPGRAVATNGTAVEFTPEILADLAESYDPALREAPLVIGHPTLEAPAYGSVGAVVHRADTGRLEAIPSAVDPSFAEAVNRRLYRAVSLSMYLPDSPSNPRPGHHYLRHVGFLGAHPPAIPGLRPVSFGETEEGVVCFGEWQTFSVLRGLLGALGRMRDWVLAERGQDTADQIIPRDELDYLNRTAAEAEAREMYDDRGEAMPLNYAEATVTTQPQDKTAEFAEREAALTAREAALLQQERAAEQRRCLDFAESLVKEGRLLPRDKLGLAEFLAALPADSTLEFGEGDEAQKTNPRAWFETFAKGLPKQVDFGEFDTGRDEAGAATATDAAIAKRAQAYHAKMQAQGLTLSFAEAVDAVVANQDQAV